MYYCVWTEKDNKGEKSLDDIVKLFTEIDDNGRVLREIGIDKDGRLVHKCPSDKFRNGTYGLFDNQVVIISDESSLITKNEFERMWEELQ
jgi:hypothetical protein